MAGTKVTELTAATAGAIDAGADVLPISDVSTSTSKKATPDALVQAALQRGVTLSGNGTIDGNGTNDFELNDISSLTLDADDLNMSGVNNVSIASTGDGASQGVVTIQATQEVRIATPEMLGGTAYADEVPTLVDASTGEVEYRRLPVTVVDSVAALKALSVASVPNGAIIKTRGYYSTADGGAAEYVYNSASSATDNGGTVIAPTTGPGRYLLQFDRVINVRQFGAKGDNTTDDTTALAAAVTASEDGTYPIYVPRGTYLITSTLNLNGNFLLYGDCQGQGAASIYTGSGSAIRYAGAGVGIQVNNGTNKQTQQFAIRNLSVIGYATDLVTKTGSIGIAFGVASGTFLSCQGSVSDVWVCGFTTCGINLVSGQGVSLNSVRASDNEVGVRLDDQTGGGNRNCIFYRCQFTNNGVGCYIKEGGGIAFHGCQIEANTREGLWISRQTATGIYNLGSVSLIDCHVENNQTSPANDGEAYAAQIRNDTTLSSGAEGAFLTVQGGRWIPRSVEATSHGRLNRLFKIRGARLYAYNVRPNAFTYPIGAMLEEATGPTPTIVVFSCDFNPWIGATPASQYPVSGGTTLQWTVSGTSNLTLYFHAITTNSVWRATTSALYAQAAIGATNDWFGDFRVRNGNLFAGPTTSYPVSSAIAAFRSTTQGVAFPQMTTAQKNAISSPAAGLVVYDTSLNKLCVYTTAWETVTSA